MVSAGRGVDMRPDWGVRDDFADPSRDSFSGGGFGAALDGAPMGAPASGMGEAKAGAVVAAADSDSPRNRSAQKCAPRRSPALKGRLHWN